MRWRRLSFRARLAWFGLLVTAFAMASFGAFLIGVGRNATPQDVEAALRDAAMTASTTLSAAEAQELPVLVDVARSDETFVIVYHPDGTFVGATGLVAGEPPRLPRAVVERAWSDGEVVEVVELLGGDGETYPVRIVALADRTDGLVVAAGRSERVVEQQVGGLRAVVWVAAIVTVLAAGWVSWIVAGRALRPLRGLVETTETIARTGDLDRRIARGRREDEVAALADGFNAMLDRLADARAALEEALDAQRRFVADASHELRTPLTTIRAGAGWLRDTGDLTDPDRVEAIADIADAADRMARLVDELLELAREDELASAGGAAPAGVVDLVGVVDRVVASASRNGLDIERRGDARAVVGDEEQLHRLLWILVDNARRHGRPPVIVRLADTGGEVVLEVEDAGPGFGDHARRVFDRFYRASPGRSGPGAGLGLAIAAAIAHRHGGRIDARDVPTGGGVVRVILPVAERR